MCVIYKGLIQNLGGIEFDTVDQWFGCLIEI